MTSAEYGVRAGDDNLYASACGYSVKNGSTSQYTTFCRVLLFNLYHQYSYLSLHLKAFMKIRDLKKLGITGGEPLKQVQALIWEMKKTEVQQSPHPGYDLCGHS